MTRRPVLAGPVERVDDPHPRRREPALVVGGFLGQHEITGAVGGQPRQQQVIGAQVARVPEFLARQPTVRAHLQQQLSGCGGQLARQRPIVKTFR